MYVIKLNKSIVGSSKDIIVGAFDNEFDMVMRYHLIKEDIFKLEETSDVYLMMQRDTHDVIEYADTLEEAIKLNLEYDDRKIGNCYEIVHSDTNTYYRIEHDFKGIKVK